MKTIIKLIILFLGIQANLLLCSSKHSEMPPHQNLLFRSIRDGDSEAVSDLIKRGVDVNVVNTQMQSSTPLHVAVLNRNPEIVQILLDAGADENAKDKQGNTPLYYTQDIEGVPSIEQIIDIFRQHQIYKQKKLE